VSKKIVRTLIISVVIFILIGVTTAGFYFGFNYIISQNERMEKLQEQFGQGENGTGINADTAGAVEIIIPRASDTKQIAELLENKGMIKNVFMFTILSKFNGFDGAYMAGTHYVLPDMGYDEIMYLLCQKPQAVRVTFPEGLTYREVKQRLTDAGVKYDEKVMDSMMRNPQAFLDYDFVTDIDSREGRDWILQGYLFPDTYEFDVNTDEETILRTFLNNTERKLIEEYYERASYIEMSMDDVIILASIIQMECQLIEEMRSVSGVFHNRIRDDMSLSACATVNYLRKENGDDVKLWLLNEDINEFDSPYNTYLNKGLPPGPICSPGDFAIRAALWPEDHQFYFFSAKGDGSNAFAEDYAQHEYNIAYYQALAEAEGNDD